MTSDEATLTFIDALESLGVPYMLVGSLAGSYYGVARLTNDADFVLQVGPQSILQLSGRLGPHFRLDPQASFEMVTLTIRHVVEVIGSNFSIELFHLSDDPYDQERFRRRRRATFMGREISVLTVEDVVVTKVRWAAVGGRSKDRNDARAVIAIHGGRIDWDYVNGWCDRLGCLAALDEIRKSIPPM